MADREYMQNARFPKGDDGRDILARMRESHTDVTTWGIALMNPQEGEAVLDIGCGGGRALKRISEMLDDVSLYGVDYSETAVQCTIEENHEDIESGRLKVTQGSVSALPYDDGSFDKIFSVESYYFWPDLVNDLKEVRRVLKDGGRAFIIADVYNRPGLEESVLENIRNLNMTNLTFEEFEAVMKEAGFRNITIHGCEGTDWICAEGMK